MELGSWSIIAQNPSLIALIPMALYIILSFAMSKVDGIIPLIISIAVGFILTGNGLASFGTVLAGCLSSYLGQCGFLIMEGAGLGVVLKKTGVSTTICKFIMKRVGVNTGTKALVTFMICEFILAGCLGSAISAASVVMPIFLPLLAATGVAPVAIAVATILVGCSAMMVGPFAAPTIMTTYLTGLSYGDYFIYGALPYVVIMAATGVFLALYMNKRAAKKGDLEHYELDTADDSDSSEAISPIHARATIVFIVVFIAAMAYAIVTSQGIAFVLAVMPVIALITALSGRMRVNDMVLNFWEGMKGTLTVFVMCVFYQMLVEVINCGGGFDALANLCISLVGGTPSQTGVMLMGTYIGAFGINGGAAAQLQIIHELFLPMIQANGLPMVCWTICLLAGSCVTTMIYPGVTVLAPMGIARTNNFKGTMICMWVSSAIVLLFVTLYSFIMPGIMG